MAFLFNLLALSQCLSPRTPYLSSFHISLFLSPSPAFYLYNYCSPLYLSPFLSSYLSLSYYYYTVSNTAAHLTFFLPNLSIVYPCHFISLIVFLPISISFFLQFSPAHFHLFFSLPLPQSLCVFFLICTSRSGGFSPSFSTLTPLAH